MADTRARQNMDIRDPDVQPIYAKWLSITKKDHSPVFDIFDTFYWWAIANGYATGAKLARHRPEEPYSPDNCYFTRTPPREDWSYEEKLSIARYNITVGKIRAARGLPPLGGKTAV